MLLTVTVAIPDWQSVVLSGGVVTLKQFQPQTKSMFEGKPLQFEIEAEISPSR